MIKKYSDDLKILWWFKNIVIMRWIYSSDIIEGIKAVLFF